MLRTLLSRLPLLTTCVPLLLAGALIGACDSGGDGDGDGDLPEVDCDNSNVPSYADLAAINSCTGCHSSDLSGADRAGAPEGVDYDNHADAMRNAESGAREVFAGRMPVGSTLGAGDKEEFYLWALCGTPQ